jgi:hypothetical protein
VGPPSKRSDAELVGAAARLSARSRSEGLIVELAERLDGAPG